MCRECKTEGYALCKRCANAKWRAANKEKVAAFNAQYYQENKAAIKEWHAKPDNAKKRVEYQRKRLQDPAKKAMVLESQARYRARNPGRNNAMAAKHRAAKKTQMPKWANEFFIKEAYSLATLRSEKTGIKWHVDHIVPLQGETVCGLHWEGNLRVIPGAENCSKKNRYWPDMPTEVVPLPVGLLAPLAAASASNHK